jgi:chemotaxis protein CheD
MSSAISLDKHQYRRAPDDYFSGSQRFVEKQSGLTIVNVHAGDCFVTSQPNEVASTVLGSCVAACIRDPEAGVGGMNHFLLPNTKDYDAASARFGAFAMETLINEIFKRGGKRQRLEVKLFGGGNVIKSSALVGDLNTAFAIGYVTDEKLKLAGFDVGGNWPRKIRYFPTTGKALVRKLSRQDDYRNVEQEERGYQQKIIIPKASDDIELF